MTHVEIAAALRQHVAADVGDGDANVAVPEVDANDGQRRIPQHQERTRPPASRVGSTGFDLLHDAQVLELGDERVHGRAREAGHPGDIGLAGPPALAQRPDDALTVSFSQPSECPYSVLRHGRTGNDGRPGQFVKSLNKLSGSHDRALDKRAGVRHALRRGGLSRHGAAE